MMKKQIHLNLKNHFLVGGIKMRRCLLVWQVPVIEGKYYNPIMYAIYIGKAKKFVNVLNEYFKEKDMDWECFLDKSACTYDEVFSSQNEVVIFVPEAKTRQWLYKKELQTSCAKKYYLDFTEYNGGQIDKIAKFFDELKEG